MKIADYSTSIMQEIVNQYGDGENPTEVLLAEFAASINRLKKYKAICAVAEYLDVSSEKSECEQTLLGSEKRYINSSQEDMDSVIEYLQSLRELDWKTPAPDSDPEMLPLGDVKIGEFEQALQYDPNTSFCLREQFEKN